MRSQHEALVEVAKERAGDALRAAVTYGTDGPEIVYRRTDIDQEMLQKRVEHAVENAERREPFMRHESVGECKADLELYDDYVLIHWHQEDLIVSFDPVVARRLFGFIEECNLALKNPNTSRFYSS